MFSRLRIPRTLGVPFSDSHSIRAKERRNAATGSLCQYCGGDAFISSRDGHDPKALEYSHHAV